VVKRYNFRMQDATHGNSLAHRARNLILLKGAVPGPKGGDVVLSPASKAGAPAAG
jgi:ribosomal protein L3